MDLVTLVKNFITPFVDVPSWVGYKQLKEMHKDVLQTIKSLFVPQKAEVTQEEDFAKVLEKFNLTEEDLKQRIKTFTGFVIFWIAVSAGILVYAVHLFGAGAWFAGLASLAIMLIALSQAFRYHFWLFQIKQRRLGCTLQEWFRAGITGEKL